MFFSLFNFTLADDRTLELLRYERDADTPDSIVSSSSPECIVPHVPTRFAGNSRVCMCTILILIYYYGYIIR